MKILFQDDHGNMIRTEILSTTDIIALNTDMISIEGWICNAFREKIRRQKDRIVELSGRGSKFTSPVDKDQILLDLNAKNSELVESARDRQDRAEKELSFEINKVEG